MYGKGAEAEAGLKKELVCMLLSNTFYGKLVMACNPMMHLTSCRPATTKAESQKELMVLWTGTVCLLAFSVVIATRRLL